MGISQRSANIKLLRATTAELPTELLPKSEVPMVLFPNEKWSPQGLLRGNKLEYEKIASRLPELFHRFYEANPKFAFFKDQYGLSEGIRFEMDFPLTESFALDAIFGRGKKSRTFNTERTDPGLQAKYTVQILFSYLESRVGDRKFSAKSIGKPRDVNFYEITVHEGIESDTSAGHFQRVADVTIPGKTDVGWHLNSGDGRIQGDNIVKNLLELLIESRGNLKLDEDQLRTKFYDEQHR
jgi:hypothetical protein